MESNDQGSGRSARLAALGTNADRLWAIGFGLVLLVAVPVIFHLGNDQWFFLDEWAVIVGRDLSPDGLLRPHNEHLIALPVLIYRAMYRLVGIQAYWPYQAFVIGAHLASAALLWVAMRRSNVRSWIAAPVAGAFVFFGSGRQDIVWAFQISFTGALAFGLAQLLLADHPGKVSWRDACACVCGLAAVLCSSVGVIMVAVVGAATFVRRGWRVALLQVAMPAVVWTTWWLDRGRGAYGETSGPEGAFDYTTKGFSHAFASLGQVRGLGLALALALVGGSILAVREEGIRQAVRSLAVPLSLLGGGLVFMAATGAARAGRTGNDVPEATRYAYLVVALFLPMLAVGVDRLADRWRGVGIGAIAILAVGVPGNVRAIRAHGYERLTLGREETVLVGAHLPELQQIAGGRVAFGWLEGPVSAGWLRDAVRNGKVPAAPDVTAAEEATVALEMAVRPTPTGGVPSGCTPLSEPQRLVLEKGSSFVFLRGPVRVRLHRDQAVSAPLDFATGPSQRVKADAGPLDLEVSPVDGAPVDICPVEGDDAQPVNDFGSVEAAYSGSGPLVAVLGDSITLAAKADLRAQLRGYSTRIAALRGEGLSGGQLSIAVGEGGMVETAAAFAEDDPEVVVIALGTNDAWYDELSLDAARSALDQITADFAGACVVTVTISETSTADGYDRVEAAEINDLLTAKAEHVVDWAASSGQDAERYLQADGIHPTEEGAALFARSVADGVKSCAR